VLWTVDANLVFTRSCGAGLAALGLVTGQVVGLSLFEYLRTDDPDFLTIRMHRHALAGERICYDDPHGGRNYEVTLEPLRDTDGRITGVIGLAHDLTELHRAADERATLQEQFLMAQKRESLGVLAAGVAHDFNNVLSAMIASAGLLLRELPPGSLHDAAALIKKATERASDVTRHMLVYAGKSLPARRPLDLSALVRENLPLLKAACTDKVTLEVRLADRVPAVHADPGQLQQVVMNLVINACEATAPTKGKVALTTGTVTEGGGLAAYLEVADTGCGMPAEARLRVFDPFFTTKGNGRGLGLSAVQGIVRAHGGNIYLTSEPGRGTTFRVILPVFDSHAAATAVPREGAALPLSAC
jgi:signal transduction histidine kinase